LDNGPPDRSDAAAQGYQVIRTPHQTGL